MRYLEQFESEDILYHYTKTTTALEHILYTKKLRLSDRIKSNDPIENMTPSTWITMNGCGSSKRVDIYKVWNDTEKRIKQLKQACFCKNDMSDRFEKIDDKPYEFYGCLKPRMWEQYADNYNGVCLIFSKNELLKQLNDTFKPDDIKYVTYNCLKEKESKVILTELVDSSYDMCKKKVFDKIDRFIFYKHEDYKGENEYRICSFPDKDLYINIESALRGIIVSGNVSLYFQYILSEYGNKHGIDVLRVDWESSGVKLDKLEDVLKVRERNQVIAEALKKRMLDKME